MCKLFEPTQRPIGQDPAIEAIKQNFGKGPGFTEKRKERVMSHPMDFHPKKILCPIDFSDLSTLALKYAVVGALQYKAGLTVLHAETFEAPRYFSPSESERLIREYEKTKETVLQKLEDHVRKILGPAFQEVSLVVQVVDGPAAEVIARQTEEDGAFDLVVIGSHGLTGWKWFFMGSVTESVVRTSRVPVFTIRQMEHNFIDLEDVEAIPRIERILCPWNGPDYGTPALGITVSMAKRFNARLSVLYTVENQGSFDPRVDELKALCSALLSADPPDVSFRRSSAKGMPRSRFFPCPRLKNTTSSSSVQPTNLLWGAPFWVVPRSWC
jgi:nucleotide-binding universal stress UspA family protein